MKHQLPKSLRRVRSCGVVNDNAKKRLVQLIGRLGVKPRPTSEPESKNKVVLCSCCHSPIVFTGMTVLKKPLTSLSI